jgi:hypothetical protein
MFPPFDFSWKKILILFIFLLTLIAAFAYSARAETVIYWPGNADGDDTQLNEASPNDNFGGNTNAGLSEFAGARLRTLINWNRTCENSSGKSAVNTTLELSLKNSGGGIKKVGAVREAKCNWTETGVTWNSYGSGGGDDCYDSGQNLTEFTYPATITGRFNITLDPTWFNNLCADPSSKFGLILFGTPDENDWWEVYTSDDGTESNWPKLILELDNSSLSPTNPDIWNFPSTTPYSSAQNITFNWSRCADEDNSTLIHYLYLINESETRQISVGNESNWTSDFESTQRLNYTIGCTDGKDWAANSTVRQFLIDWTNPLISIGTNDTLHSNNIRVDKSKQNITSLSTFSDDNLFSIRINITNSTGDHVYNFTKNNLNQSSYTHNSVVDITDWPLGEYSIFRQAWDDHTKNSWQPEKITKDANLLKIDDIIIECSTCEPKTDLIQTKQEKDRVTFEFQTNIQGPKDYLLTCPEPLMRRHLSKYNGHFICGRHWIDFENENDQEVTIEFQKGAHTAKIRTDATKFRSVGGLNQVNQTYSFNISASVMVSIRDAYDNSSIDFTAEIDGKRVSSTSGTANFSNVTGVLQLLNVTGDYVVGSLSNHTIANGSQNITLFLERKRSVILKIFDEMTGVLQKTPNFHVLVYNSTDDLVKNFILHDGTAYIKNLGPPGRYRFRAQATGSYPARELLHTVEEQRNNLTMYVLNSTDGHSVQLVILDSSLNTQQNAKVLIQRILNSSLKNISDTASIFDGTTAVQLDPNYKYRIKIEHEEYAPFNIELEPQLSSYDVQLDEPQIPIPVIPQWISARDIRTNLSYNNETKNMSLELVSGGGSGLTLYCLELRTGIGELLNNTCNSSSVSLISYILDDNQTYVGRAFITLPTGKTFIIDSLTVSTVQFWKILGKNSPYLAFLIILTTGLIGATGGGVGVIIGTLLGTGIVVAFGMTPLTWPLLLALIFVGFISIMLMVKSSGDSV